ncbi:hypothetical protein CH273_11190 [Rhodococcus sp. 05-339-2]|nr:hypothetical protein CH273_11190 [Rhodococcus sp. 05-339-2]
MLLCHGWPGLYLEVLDLVPLLTDQDDADLRAFDVIVPSVPGFDFCTSPSGEGWSTDRVAQAFVELMSIGGSLPHIDRNTSREMYDGTPAAADAAFFAANRNGRNRIALARPHIAESSNRG